MDNGNVAEVHVTSRHSAISEIWQIAKESNSLDPLMTNVLTIKLD